MVLLARIIFKSKVIWGYVMTDETTSISGALPSEGQKDRVVLAQYFSLSLLLLFQFSS